MARARVFMPENRLASIIGGPGDATADVLERNAEARLETLKDDIRGHVFSQLRVIEYLSAQPEEIIFAECGTLKESALAICEVASVAGMADVGEAARGIVAMIGALFSDGVWHTEALKLHLEAVALFAGDTSVGPERTQQTLARLKAMRDWIGVPN